MRLEERAGRNFGSRRPKTLASQAHLNHPRIKRVSQVCIPRVAGWPRRKKFVHRETPRVPKSCPAGSTALVGAPRAIERPRNLGFDVAPDVPAWYVHIPWFDGEVGLCSSRVLVISKSDGHVLIDGSANDEG